MSALYRYLIPIAPQEFDFAKTVEAGQSFRWFKLSPETWTGADGDHWYRVKVLAGNLDVSSNVPESAFRALFRMEESLEAIGERIQAICPELATTVAAARGLRLMRHACKREVVFSFLCSSMNSIPRIKGMVSHLARLDYQRDSQAVDGLPRFPTLEALAELSEADLRAKRFGYRAPFIPHVARQILDRGGESFLDQLEAETYPNARDALLELTGIGPKVADCILLLAYGKGEAFPIDTHVLQAVARLHNPQWRVGSLTLRKYQEIGDFYRSMFGSLAGYAQHLLFFGHRNRSKQ